MPDDTSLDPLSKNMLLLRSISQSCISSLHDSLAILTRRRTPDNDLLQASVPSAPSVQSSTTIMNTSNRQLSQSFNSSTSGKSTTPISVPSQSNPFATQYNTSNLGGYNQSNESNIINKDMKK
ncbi:unnamed protein product [Rotaria magnacalcarata]|nr:unnamed protein product [Rotaria magnacalcarata]